MDFFNESHQYKHGDNQRYYEELKIEEAKREKESKKEKAAAERQAEIDHKEWISRNEIKLERARQGGDAEKIDHYERKLGYKASSSCSIS